MRKIYIAPETELIVFLKEQPLCAGTTEVTGKDETGNEGKTGPEMGGDGTGGDFARQHNNWMWDNLEDEY